MFRLVIPLYQEPPLPWGYFMLQAARGGVDVPYWAHAALPLAVADRCNLTPEAVDDDHLYECVERITPLATLNLLTDFMELKLPNASTPLRLREEALWAPHHPTVPQHDLLHDVAVTMQQQFGCAPLRTAMRQLEDPKAWNRRAAVAVMVYALSIRIS